MGWKEEKKREKNSAQPDQPDPEPDQPENVGYPIISVGFRVAFYPPKISDIRNSGPEPDRCTPLCVCVCVWGV